TGAAGSNGKFDARPVTQPFPTGHYKLTVNTGMGDGKHKVFKVECGTAGSNKEAAKVREHLMSAIKSAQNVSARLATTISIAQQLILSGTLNSTELANITNAREAAITAAITLTINLTAAQSALEALNNAIASGTAEAAALLLAGGLTQSQVAALTNAINSATPAATALTNNLIPAQNALSQLNTAISLGNLVEIAAKVAAAQLPLANLNAAITGA